MNMEALKNLPIGVQNFEKLRRDGYLYVDKTALMYRLAHEGNYYFLSRAPTLRQEYANLHPSRLLRRTEGPL